MESMGKEISLAIKGFSMYPVLRSGDRVTVDPETGETLSCGELIAFYQKDDAACHRLIALEERDGAVWIRTKGDAILQEDPPTPLSQVIGKIVRIERKGRSWIPEKTPPKLTLRQKSFLFLKRKLWDRFKAKGRPFLILLQSFAPFRKIYRFLLRPDATIETAEKGRKVRLLARVDEAVVGFLEMNPKEDASREWEMTRLFVRARYRGCGVATKLLTHALRLLREEESVGLTVSIPFTNRAGSALLRTFGFRASPHKATVYEKRLPDLEFRVARQMLFEQTLLEIREAFWEKKLPFLVLKGMALAYQVYPDPALRPMGDIDLYLRKEDIEPAASVLAQLGYQELYPEFRKERMAFGGERIFLRPGNPPVELHWSLEQFERLKGILRIEEEALWESSSLYTICGKSFRALSPEHHLIALCIHLGFVHRFEGDRWFADIDRMIFTFGNTLSWESLFRTARSWGVLRVVCEILRETEARFHTPLPSLPLKRPSFMFRAWPPLDHPLDHLRVLWKILFPSREWLLFRYRLNRKRGVWLFRLLHPFFMLTGRIGGRHPVLASELFSPSETMSPAVSHTGASLSLLQEGPLQGSVSPSHNWKVPQVR